MNRYILFLTNPEERYNKIVYDFEAESKNFLKEFSDIFDINNSDFNNLYFYILNMFLQNENVKKIMSEEFKKNVYNENFSKEEMLFMEFEEKKKKIFEIIDQEEDLIDFFYGQKVWRYNIFIIEDSCGVWKKLLDNGFTYEF